MKKKHIVLVSILCLITLIFTACGSTSMNNAATYESNNIATPMAPMDSAGGVVTDTTVNGVDTSVTMPQDARKIIRNARIDMEALRFDDTCAAVKQAVADANGYLSYSEASGIAGESQRYAQFTCRIPAEKYDTFMTQVGENGNVTNVTEETEDITMAYVDVEARLTSLHTQEERLMDMLAKSGDLETLLAVQQQLTEVQYQIESYTAQQRTYDDLLSYCTVQVTINEVRVATPSANSFGNRIAAAFSQTGQNVVTGAQDFVILFIYALPALVILAIVILVILRCTKKQRARTKSMRAAMPTATMPTGSTSAVPAKTPAEYPTEPKENK